MKKYILFILLLIFLIFVFIGQGIVINDFDLVVKSNYGSVNWTKHYFESSGSAILNQNMKNVASNELITLKKAENEGYKNLFNLIVYQYLDSKRKVIDLIKENPDLTLSINNYIHFSRKSDIIYKSDKKEIKYYLPFTIEQGNIYSYIDLKRNYYLKINYKSRFPHTTKFTGLVIDARGFDLNPCLKMKILNENRKLFFYFDNVKWEYILKYGYITYITDPLSINKLQYLIGKKPYKLAALSSFGINNTDIIISNNDIDIFLGNPENVEVLYEGRIVVIVDKK